MNGFRVFKAVLHKEMLTEWRSRDRVIAMLVFSLLVVVIYHFALPELPHSEAPSTVSGLLWSAYLFAAILGLNRSFSAELENHALTGLAMAPLDRGWIFLGKALANFILLVLIQGITATAFALGFDLDLRSVALPLAGVLALGAVGITSIGTLFAAIAVRTRNQELLLPLLLLPLLMPVLIAATTVTRALLLGEAVPTTPLRLLVMTDTIFLIVSFICFEYALDE
ncbi:MAG: heme exporter protein CcmB [Deltaproteobacteria bacterium]|nr:heme exporter protein CcmB [Deltaproteobacteria bacterium]